MTHYWIKMKHRNTKIEYQGDLSTQISCNGQGLRNAIKRHVIIKIKILQIINTGV